MTKPPAPRPEPTTGTPYDIFLVPRSKTPVKNELYEHLLSLGWRFDTVRSQWHTPEGDRFQAAGRLEYAYDLSWARIQPPNAPDSTIRQEPIITFTRTNEGWS